jgi:hypothetical protein
MPISKETATRINIGRKHDVERTDDGSTLVGSKKLTLLELGNFQRQASPKAKAFGFRAKVAAEKRLEYCEQMNAGNRSEHEQDILDNPLVRGFLQEGAAAIARAVRIAELPAEIKRFYPPGMTTTEEEYETKVRDPVDFFFDDAFSIENGRPSISTLIKNLPVGALLWTIAR